MNRTALFAALVGTFTVATAAIEQIGDPRWRALAALATVVVGWIIGLHSTAPSYLPPPPSTEAPPEPGTLAELLDEMRRTNRAVADLSADVRRAIELSQVNEAKLARLDLARIVPRVEALERVVPTLPSSEPSSEQSHSPGEMQTP